MDLVKLERRTGLPRRDLRYVIANRLLPGLGEVGQGRGRARQFTPGGVRHRPGRAAAAGRAGAAGPGAGPRLADRQLRSGSAAR